MDKKHKEDALIKVRVLVDCAVGKAGSVVELTKAEVEANVGQVDPNPDSVAYAEKHANE